MNHPAKYYAARTAAINEALAEERARVAAAAAGKQSQNVPRIYSAESLRRCGERVQVLLGSFWGELDGTYVEAVYCYSVGTGGMYIAKMQHPLDHHEYIVLVAEYAQRDDVYNRVISIVAVL